MTTTLGWVPLLAMTGFGTVTTTIGNQQSVVLENDASGQPDCNTMVTGQWSTSLTGQPCSSLQLWITAHDECEGGDPGSPDLMLPPVPAADFLTGLQKTGTVSFSVTDLVATASVDGGAVACGQGHFQQAFLLCAAISMDTTSLCTTKEVVQTSSGTNTAAEIFYDTLSSMDAGTDAGMEGSVDGGADGGSGGGAGHGCGCAADPGALGVALAIAALLRRTRAPSTPRLSRSRKIAMR